MIKDSGIVYSIAHNVRELDVVRESLRYKLWSKVAAAEVLHRVNGWKTEGKRSGLERRKDNASKNIKKCYVKKIRKVQDSLNQ